MLHKGPSEDKTDVTDGDSYSVTVCDEAGYSSACLIEVPEMLSGFTAGGLGTININSIERNDARKTHSNISDL